MNIPKYLFHARANKQETFRIAKITGKDGMTSLCEVPEHTGLFMKLYHGKGEFYVLKIDTDKLDKSKFSISHDHNPDFFPSDMKVHLYKGFIPVEAIEEGYITLSVK